MKSAPLSSVTDSAGRRKRRVVGVAGLVAVAAAGLWLTAERRNEAAPAVKPSLASAAAPQLTEVRRKGDAAMTPISTQTTAAANEAFVRELDEILAGRTQGSIPKIAAVIVRWVAADPRAAMMFLENFPSHDPRRMGSSVSGIEEWLKRDPAAAMAFAKEAIWRDAANADYLVPVLKSLVRPESADPFGELKRYLDQLPQIEAVYSQVAQAIGAGLKSNLSAAEAFNESLPAGMRFDGLLGGAKAQAWGFAAIEALTAKRELNAGDREQLAGRSTFSSARRPTR